MSDPYAMPLALLGEALIHQYQKQYNQEAGCFETAFARYAHHPLIHVWHDQLLSRLLENRQFDRDALHRLLLQALKFVPEKWLPPFINDLLDSLNQTQEPLYFLNDQRSHAWPPSLARLSKIIRLSFWLASPETLAQAIDDQLKEPTANFNSIANALCALLELGAYGLVERKLEVLYEQKLDVQAMAKFDWIHEAVLIHQNNVDLSPSLRSILPHRLEIQSMRVIMHILYEALRKTQIDTTNEAINYLEKNHTLPLTYKQVLISFRIWAFLLEKRWDSASLLLNQSLLSHSIFPPLSRPFLTGCYLAGTETFANACNYLSVQVKEHPLAIGRLFGLFISSNQTLNAEAFSQAFMWEKRQFFRQATLFYLCADSKDTAEYYQALERQEYINPLV